MTRKERAIEIFTQLDWDEKVSLVEEFYEGNIDNRWMGDWYGQQEVMLLQDHARSVNENTTERFHEHLEYYYEEELKKEGYKYEY